LTDDIVHDGDGFDGEINRGHSRAPLRESSKAPLFAFQPPSQFVRPCPDSRGVPESDRGRT
jgi:hypothetical protein